MTFPFRKLQWIYIVSVWILLIWLQTLTLALFTSKCSESNLFFSTCSCWRRAFSLMVSWLSVCVCDAATCQVKFRGRATKDVTAIRRPCEGQIKGANTKEEREFTLHEQKDRRHGDGVLAEGGTWMKSGRKKKQEERTGEELLMALLLSLSADCDSQDQLLSKTTSPRKRRKCSQEVMGVRERWGRFMWRGIARGGGCGVKWW